MNARSSIVLAAALGAGAAIAGQTAADLGTTTAEPILMEEIIVTAPRPAADLADNAAKVIGELEPIRVELDLAALEIDVPAPVIRRPI